MTELGKRPEPMKAYLEALPGQVAHGYALGKKTPLPSEFSKVRQIVFCGIGGSAIGMDILAQAMHGICPIPFSVHRGPGLPGWVSREALVVLTSYSGDTQETLDVLKEAVSRKAHLLAVTSGGRLAREARKRKFPWVEVPSGMPPRCAVGLLTFSLAAVLSRGGWLKFTASDIADVQKALASGLSKARSLAGKLKGRMIFLYGDSASFDVVMKRWRAQFAENAKTLASHQGMPEMFHNEIEGWSFPSFLPGKSAVIVFQDPQESPAAQKKAALALRMINGQGAKVIRLKPQGKTPFEKMFSLIALGDWTSYELARLNQVDPVAIPKIRRIKETR